MAGIQFLSSAALVLFWGREYVRPTYTAASLSGSLAIFPAPDSVLLVLMAAAIIGLMTGNRLGKALTAVVGIVFLFLGIAGFRMNLADDWLLVSMVSLMKSGFVNLWCVVFGLYFLLKLKEKHPKNRNRNATHP